MKEYFLFRNSCPALYAHQTAGLASARNLLPDMNESMSNKETKQVVPYERMTWGSKCLPEISIALKRLQFRSKGLFTWSWRTPDR